MEDKEKKLIEEIKLLQNKVKELEKSALNHINAEADLKRATKEWELTFNAVTDLIFTLDKEHKIINANKAFANFINLKPEDIIGKYCYELVHQTNKPIPGCPVEKTMKDGRAHTEEVDEPRLGASFLVSASPIFDDKGQFIGAVHIAKDISGFKKSTEARAQLAAIVEYSEDAIIGKSLEGIILSWNKGAEKIYGYSAEEVIGRPISMLVTPSNYNEIPAILERIKRSESIEHYETLRLRKDGAQIFVSLTVSPIKDASGNIIGASTIARDITESKMVDEALKESENNYRTVFENVPVGIYRNTVELDSRFLGANPAMVKMFGYDSLDEFLKIHTKDLYVNPEERKLFVDEITAKGIVRERELHLKKKDGIPIWCAITAKIQHDESGKIKWIDGVAEDISERKSLEEELNKRIGTLERFQRVTVDRELKMKELKSRIAELETKLQQNNKKE